MAQNYAFLIAFGIIIPEKGGNDNPRDFLSSLFFGPLESPKPVILAFV